jgi:hypothetical protein
VNYAISAASWWAFTGAAIAILCEYLYRVLQGPWWHYLWAWVPLQVAVGYCVYRLVSAPGATLLDAFIVWTFSTIALRIAVTVFLLNDPVRPGTWAALCLVIMARVTQTWWR